MVFHFDPLEEELGRWGLPRVGLNDSGVRAVFFDAVGTLLHPAAPVAQTYRQVAARHGVVLDSAVISKRLRESFDIQEQIDSAAGWKTNEAREAERWRRIVRDTLREATDTDACFFDLWQWYSQSNAWTAHAETAMVLAELTRRGIAIGMASNFDARLAAIIDGIPALAPLAERCAISSVVGWRKPAKEFFEEVIRLAECAPEEILFVGDDPRNDLEGARAAGMQALLLDPEGKNEAAGRIATLAELV
jgi:putative hydrolase of the HAD superfamily